MAQDGGMVNELLEKDMEGVGSGLIEGIIPEFAWEF